MGGDEVSSIELDRELTETEWVIVCRMTDIQSKVAEMWRDLVTNGEAGYLVSHLDELERMVVTLGSIARYQDKAA